MFLNCNLYFTLKIIFSEFPLDALLSVQLCLQLGIAGPWCIHMMIALVDFFQLLVFFLLLVVICQHFLVGIIVYQGFSLRCARTFFLCFDHHFLFFVFAKVV